MHAKLRVDNSELVHTHLACANCVPKTRRGKSRKFLDLLGARLGPWNEFALAQTVEGMLVSDFTCGFDRAHDRRKITIRAEIVPIDHGGILKVGADQADGTYAGGLHKQHLIATAPAWTRVIATTSCSPGRCSI